MTPPPHLWCQPHGWHDQDKCPTEVGDQIADAIADNDPDLVWALVGDGDLTAYL